MAKKRTKEGIDAELLRQMDEVSDSEKPVEAVFILHSDDPSQIVPQPEKMKELTYNLLERVKQNTGVGNYKYNVFQNMGSFVVSAPSSFIKELMSQPEVAKSIANRQPGEPTPEPVKKRPVTFARRQKADGSSKKSKAGSARTKNKTAQSGK